MDSNNIWNDILEIIGNLGWWLYVTTHWRKNDRIRARLRKSKMRDNLGYYLKEE